MPVANTALRCSIILLLLVSTHAAIETDSWMKVGTVSPDSKYLFGSESMIQTHAKSFCRSKGGTLVIIDSQAEHDMLRKHLNTSEGTSNWWINLESDGEFRDVNDTKRTNWFSTDATGSRTGFHKNMYTAFDRQKTTDKSQDDIVNATAAPAVTDEDKACFSPVHKEHDKTNPNYWNKCDKGSAQRGPNTNSRNCAALWYGDGTLPSYYRFSSVRCHSNRVVTTDLIIKPICEKKVANVKNAMPDSTCSYDKFLFPNPDKKILSTNTTLKECWERCKSNTECVSIDFDTIKDVCSMYKESAYVENVIENKDVTEKNITEILKVMEANKICDNSNSRDYIVDVIQNISPMACRYQGVAWCTSTEFAIIDDDYRPGTSKKWNPICGVYHSEGKCTLYKAKSKEFQCEELCKRNTGCVSFKFDTTKDTLEDGCALYSEEKDLSNNTILYNTIEFQLQSDVCPGYITSHVLAPDDNFIHCSGCRFQSSIIILISALLLLTTIYRA